MSIGFNDTNGEAKKVEIDYYKFEDGTNKFRLVGDVLPRYIYWRKTPDGQKTMGLECLAFDREKEKFVKDGTAEKDWVQHYFPEDKCSWSYVMRAYDEDGKLKVVPLKKKLFQAIKKLAQKHPDKFGDPTDPDTGWMCVVEREKTGPLAYNVEYTLDAFSCETLPLTDEQKEELENAPPLETLFPRPTPEEQKAFIERVWFSTEEEEANDDMNDMNDDI
jgi:hypothetical protein